jgi:hypothetical protein
MARASVMTAVRTRLGESVNAWPVRYPNETAEPPGDGSPWWEVQYPLADSEQITIGAPGNNVFRDTGVIRILLAVPRGQDVVPYETVLESVMALFRSKQFSGVSTYAPSPPVLHDRSDSGAFWSLSTSIPYYADLLA